MGSVKEDIAGIIAELPKGTIGITDPAWANKRLQQAYPKAAQILSLVCKRIEGVKLTDDDIQTIQESWTEGDGSIFLYEFIKDVVKAFRQASLDVIKEE